MISYSIILLALPLYSMEQVSKDNLTKSKLHKVTYSSTSDNNNLNGKTPLELFNNLPIKRRQEITRNMRKLTANQKIENEPAEKKEQLKDEVYTYFVGEVTETKTENPLHGYSAMDKLHKRIQQQSTSASDK